MTDKPKDRRHRKRTAKNPRRAHVQERHARAVPPPEVLLEAVPISIDGQHIGDVHVRPGTQDEVTTRAIATLADLGRWSQLGAELADLGEHRLKIAGHAARTAAGGGQGVSAEEEDRIADWFRGIVRIAIQRGGLRAARAIWFVLVSDNQRDPRGAWMARCPALERIGVPPPFTEDVERSPKREQKISEWLAAFSDAAVSYVRHTVAGATAEDVTELRELIHADDDTLDALYAPAPFALADHDPHEALYQAMSILTRRRLDNAQVSGALESWALGSQEAVQEHAWEPPLRLGVCAWLARVALRPEEQAA